MAKNKEVYHTRIVNHGKVYIHLHVLILALLTGLFFGNGIVISSPTSCKQGMEYSQPPSSIVVYQSLSTLSNKLQNQNNAVLFFLVPIGLELWLR